MHTNRYKFYFKFLFMVFFFTSLSNAQFKVTATDSILKKVCGTNKVKCAFIANGALWYIDFSVEQPAFKSIQTDSAPSVPVISPDGTNVTFVTGVQSEPPFLKATTAWICSLQEGATPQKVAYPAYNPRFEQNSSEMAVIYATSGTQANGKKYVFDGNGVVARKKIQTATVDTIWRSGSWFGGLSYDGKWLCTAESELNAFMVNITGDPASICYLHSVKVQKTGGQKDTVIRLQTCNPSISSSRNFPDAMMYLDFSSDNITDAGYFHPVLGTWGVHERIFISRSNGSIVCYLDTPQDPSIGPFTNVSGKGNVAGSGWENPEWSNHPYFAAAALNVVRIWESGDRQPVEKNEAIYLINLHDSSYVKIAELNEISASSKTNIRFPWIWVEVPADFSQTEDKEWLAKPVSSAIQKRQETRRLVDEGVHFSGSILTSTSPMISVELFTPDGRLVYRKDIKSEYSVIFPGNLSVSRVIIVKVKFYNGTRSIKLLRSVR